MKFFTILRASGLDDRFIDLLREVPFEQLKNLGITKIDRLHIREQYKKRRVQDVSIDSSANVNKKSAHNLRDEQGKAWSKIEGLYCIWKETGAKLGIDRADYIILEVLKGHVYIHKLNKFDMPHCFSISVKNIFDQGLPFTNPVAIPPKHPMSFTNQCIELVMSACQEQNGAIAISSYAPCMAAIIHRGEKKWTRKEIENYFQNLVHVFNHPFRAGGDSPFTNISIFSPTFLREMYANYVYGEYTYDDISDTVDWVQDIMMDFMAKGDPVSNMMYRFPIVTLNIHPDDFDTPQVEKMLRYNKKGYFNINVTDQIALCCRLQVKKKQRMSSLGTGGDNIGAFAIVTVNTPSIFYQSIEDGKSHEAVLADRLSVCHDILQCLKTIIMGWKNHHVLMAIDWMHESMMYLTVGIHGTAEYALMASGADTFGEEWLDVHEQQLQLVADTVNGWDDADYNFEMVPAEGSTRFMADSNNIMYGANDRFYSNQFVPLYADMPIHERLKIEDRLCAIVTGGTMTFINLDGNGDPEAILNIQKKILKNYNIPQFAINIGVSKCDDCNRAVIGKVDTCICGGSMDFYTRIVGFFVAKSEWEQRRQEELESRKWHVIG